jgi:hypothetical protein
MRPLFLGGVPTKPDVDKLIDAYPAENMTQGTIIGYDEIAEVIGKTSISRFRTITNAWRKQLFQGYGIVLDPSKKFPKAFEVLSEFGKVQKSQAETHSGIKKQVKAVRIISAVDVAHLSKEQRSEYDVIAKRAAALIAVAQLRRPPILPEIQEAAAQ